MKPTNTAQCYTIYTQNDHDQSQSLDTNGRRAPPAAHRTEPGPPKYCTLLSDRRQLDVERRLLPQGVHFLLSPVLAVSFECQIEVEEDLGQDDAHLVVSQASLC